MPDFPHENLPLDQLSLSQFTYLMQQAFKSGDDLQYINTALCGRTTDEEGDWRISVNARQELHPPEYPRFTRDYDSAIGITKNLPFLTALYVFPVPSFKETLKKRNHVKAIIVSCLLAHGILSCSLPSRMTNMSHCIVYQTVVWAPLHIVISQGYSSQSCMTKHNSIRHSHRHTSPCYMTSASDLLFLKSWQNRQVTGQ